MDIFRGRGTLEASSVGLVDGSVPADPMLYGHIDEPSVGTRVRPGPLLIRGWHRWADQPALAVAASIGDRVLGAIHVGSETRLDVAESTGNPSLISAGWVLNIELQDVPIGEVSIDISVWGAIGHGPVHVGSVEVDVRDEEEDEAAAEVGASRPCAPPDKFFGRIDLPHDDEVSTEMLRVVGYALTEPHPIASLEVRLNGRGVGRARLGLERPDLLLHHDVPHACIAGFEHLVELPDDVRRRGKATVEIVGRTAVAGPVTVASRSWDVRVASDDPEVPDRPAGPVRRARPIRPSRSAPSEHLHLAVFTHDMGYGGGQLWLTELLAKAAAGRSFDCTIVTTKDGPLTTVMRGQGISVHVTQPFPLDDAVSYDGRVEELSGWLQRQGCSAALGNTFLTFPGVDAALRAELPVVWAIHESWTPTAIWSVAYPEGYVDSDVRRRAEAVLRRSHALAFEADATRAQYEQAAGKERTVVVPYGIDVASIERYRGEVSRDVARQELGIPDDRRVLLVMGTTEPRKAQTLLAEAFQRVAARHGEVLLVMVGDTGTSYADGLRTYVELAGLSRQIRILPVVKDTYQWYRAADVLVCASDVESLPRSVLEAMCFGLPVLATSVFGLAELIDDGQTGFLFEPCDLDTAAAALERVLAVPPDDLTAVAEQARELVRREYDSSGYAADFLALVEGLRRDPATTPSEILRLSGRRARG